MSELVNLKIILDTLRKELDMEMMSGKSLANARKIHLKIQETEALLSNWRKQTSPTISN
jgi:hypothetical protein